MVLINAVSFALTVIIASMFVIGVVGSIAIIIEKLWKGKK